VPAAFIRPSASSAEPRPTAEGDEHRAFYLSYHHTDCEYPTADGIFEKLDDGIDTVSATS
jgi:hypothetical protein